MVSGLFSTSLTVNELSASRGNLVLFDTISFRLDAGEALRITGPNGCGKTTLIRCVAGLVRPDSGQIKCSVENAFHYLGHLNAMKPQLTVAENLMFWGRTNGVKQIEPAIKTLNLNRLKDLPFGVLSSGQKRRTAFARLLLSPRPIWLLDEPTVGLDAASLTIFGAAFEQHLQLGGIIIAATHTPLGTEKWRTLDLQRVDQ